MFVKGMKESLRAKLISLENFESMTLAAVHECLKPLETDSVETSAHLSALTNGLDSLFGEEHIRQGWVPPNGKKPYQKRTHNKQNTGDNNKKKWSKNTALTKHAI